MGCRLVVVWPDLVQQGDVDSTAKLHRELVTLPLRHCFRRCLLRVCRVAVFHFWNRSLPSSGRGSLDWRGDSNDSCQWRELTDSGHASSLGPQQHNKARHTVHAFVFVVLLGLVVVAGKGH